MGQRIKDNLNNTYQSGMWGGRVLMLLEVKTHVREKLGFERHFRSN